MDQTTQTPTPVKQDKKRDGKRTALIVLLLLIILGMAVGGYLVWRNLQKEDVLEPNATIGMMPGKTDQEIIDELNRKVDEKSIAFSINSQPTLDKKSGEINWMFENPESNDKYTKLVVQRDDTGEVIYETKLITNGSYVESAKLSTDLPAGSYICTAYIHGYRLSDQSYLGQVAAGITVVIPE